MFQLQKFLMTFFSHWLSITFEFLPYFRYNATTFPHISGSFIFLPTFRNFPSDFWKLMFFAYFACFLFPPSLTMMHLCIHTMHVLDAPERMMHFSYSGGFTIGLPNNYPSGIRSLVRGFTCPWFQDSLFREFICPGFSCSYFRPL